MSEAVKWGRELFILLGFVLRTVVPYTFISIVKFVSIREFFTKRIIRIIRVETVAAAGICVWGGSKTEG